MKRRTKMQWRVFLALILWLIVACCSCTGNPVIPDADNPTISTETSTPGSDTLPPTSFEVLSEQELTQYYTGVDQMRTLVKDALDGKTYFTWAELPAVLDQMEQCAINLMQSGVIVDYDRNEYGVYMEFASGVPCICTPPMHGIDGSRDIYAFSPFANEVMNDETGVLRGNLPKDLKDIISTTFPELSEGLSFSNDHVDEELLQGLQSKVFLWNGHGGYTDALGPVLLTGEKVQGNGLLKDAALLLSKQKAMHEGFWIERGNRYAITAKFVKEYIRMEDGFVYLAACHSLQTEQMARAFLNNGAEIVFGATQSIMSGYDMDMMNTIIQAMCGKLDGIIHTAQEALKIAQGIHGVDDGAVRDAWGYGGTPASITYLGKHVDSGDYTFCAGIRGHIRAAISTGQDNAVLLPDSAIVRLYDQEGNLTASTICDESDRFYFNNLDPGVYSVEVTYNHKLLTTMDRIDVQAHRCTSIEIGLTPVWGIVVDEQENRLPAVTVEALLNGEVIASTTTEASGQYNLLLCDNDYTLRFSQSGYKTCTKDITVQTGNTPSFNKELRVDDVILQTGEIIYQGEHPYTDALWTLYEGYHLVISPVSEGKTCYVGENAALIPYQERVVSIELKPGVKLITARAFSDFKALERISLPDTLTSIDEKAFENCIRLKSVTIPRGVRLDDAIFKGCSSLESVLFLGDSQIVYAGMFENCYSLKNIHLTDIIYVRERAFSGCIQLKDVYYSGTQAQWSAIKVGHGNDALNQATIHFETK